MIKNNKISPQMLANNIAQEILEFDVIYYCLVKKESQSGLLLNNRLLIIQQSDYTLYYTRDIPTKPYFKTGVIPTGKQKVRISEIKIEHNKQTCIVVVKKEKLKLIWKFKFENYQIMEKWLYLVDRLQEKACCVSLYRKSLKSTQSTSSLAFTEQAIEKTMNRQHSVINFKMPIDEVKQEEHQNMLLVTKSFQKLNSKKLLDNSQL